MFSAGVVSGSSCIVNSAPIPDRTTIKGVRRFFPSFVLFGCLAVSGQSLENAAVQRATAELDRVKKLVDAGAAPRVSLEQAQRALTETQDDVVVAQTLYGKVGVEEMDELQAREMVAAARRQVDRETSRLESLQKLVDQGVAARADMAPLRDDLQFRQKTLDLALSRSRLIGELAVMARVEAETIDSDDPGPVGPVAERYDGSGVFRDADFKRVVLAFEKKFSHPLPVSARGETALHRALGFDHRGRVDVAMNPDAPEGVWLRQYLTTSGIPYFAFRAAVSGQATGPHIHLGPPSLRLGAAD